MFRLAAALIVSPLILIGACNGPQSDDGADGKTVLSYEDAYIMAPLGGRDVSVGGIKITVDGADVRLTGVTSDAAETVETHSMAMVDDRMQMRPVKGWDLGDGDTLTFERGGGHLMLFGVDQTLSPGDTANLTFYFDVNGQDDQMTLEAVANVRGPGE